MIHDPFKALYIHIPFCVRRCNYCDFTTQAIAQDAPAIDSYVESLITALRRASKEEELGAIETVYLGGGTPSYLGSRRLSSLLYALSVSMHLTPEVECTLEANPESVNDRLVKDLWALGVNRISLGVQSFDNEVLELLGRAHNADQARRAIAIIQERFKNISIDLMAGIPGQTMESFEASVATAIEAQVTHVSIYPLSIEPDTPFARAVSAHEMADIDEDIQASMMERAATLLEDAGFHRYEVASYAKPGFECRHNKAYWSGVPYLGIGTAAATMMQNSERRLRLTNGVVTDDLNPAQMLAEDLMLAMRMTEGLSQERAIQAAELLPETPDVFKELLALGLVTEQEGRLKPTELGWLYGNELYGRLLDLAP